MRPFDTRFDNESINSANVFNESISTDVESVTSDATYKKGFSDFPIFDVTEQEFNANMEVHRQRCRFKSPKVVEYMQKTRYKNPFYIRFTEEASGKQYIRKIK